MTGNPRNAMVCDTPYLQNEFGDPRFFYVFNLILSFSTLSQSIKKICTWDLLGANVRKVKQAGLSSRSPSSALLLSVAVSSVFSMDCFGV